MRLEQLEYLIGIHRYGSMSLASENLHVSPQTLSIAIKNLETELGIKLLERSVQGTLLNREGETIVQLSREILDRIKEIKDFAQSSKNGIPDQEVVGKLAIAFVLPAMHADISNLIKGFRNRYPEIIMNFRAIKHSRVLAALVANEIDFGYLNVGTTFAKESLLPIYQEQITMEVINKGKLGVIVSKKSPLAKQKSVCLKGLRPYHKVTYDKEHFYYMGIAEEMQGLDKVIECTDKDLLWDLVCNNKAVALSTCGCFHMYPQSFRDELSNIVLDDNIDIMTLLCSPKAREKTVATEKFKAYFLDYMGAEY